MLRPTPGSPPEREPDVDYRIQEIADSLVRMARSLPVRLSGEGPFLEMVARILKRENRTANCLKCAIGLYDKLFESMFQNMDQIITPDPDVIDVRFEPDITARHPFES